MSVLMRPSRRRAGTHRGPRSEHGIGMIEVLIAMVVVAIAVLGISRMQIIMLRQNQSALHRSQASILAYDISDRLRVDRQAALDGDYDRDLGDARPTGSTVPALAVDDWLDMVAAALPSGDGAIARNAGVVIVTLRWDDSRGTLDPVTGDPVLLTFTTSLAL